MAQIDPSNQPTKVIKLDTATSLPKRPHSAPATTEELDTVTSLAISKPTTEELQLLTMQCLIESAPLKRRDAKEVAKVILERDDFDDMAGFRYVPLEYLTDDIGLKMGDALKLQARAKLYPKNPALQREVQQLVHRHTLRATRQEVSLTEINFSDQAQFGDLGAGPQQAPSAATQASTPSTFSSLSSSPAITAPAAPDTVVVQPSAPAIVVPETAAPAIVVPEPAAPAIVETEPATAVTAPASAVGVTYTPVQQQERDAEYTAKYSQACNAMLLTRVGTAFPEHIKARGKGMQQTITNVCRNFQAKKPYLNEILGGTPKHVYTEVIYPVLKDYGWLYFSGKGSKKKLVRLKPSVWWSSNDEMKRKAWMAFAKEHDIEMEEYARLWGENWAEISGDQR